MFKSLVYVLLTDYNDISNVIKDLK